MKITRVYADSNGESHFKEIDVRLNDAGEIGLLTDEIPAQSVIFRENAPDYDYDWHQAPQRQYVVLLDGEIELEVSDGERRSFRGGDVLLLEDTYGRGHRTRTTDANPRRSIFITLPGDGDEHDIVEEAGEESFPASDPPGWTGSTI